MKKFEELSLSFQKRRIVKDAIKQINEGVVTIKAGSGYLRGLYTGDYDTKNLQEILQNNKRVCTVCAKGSYSQRVY